MTRKALDTSGFLIAVIELAKLERQRAPEATEKVIDFCQKKLDEFDSKQFGQSELDFLEKLTATVWENHPEAKFCWLIGYDVHKDDPLYYERIRRIGRDPRMDDVEIRVACDVTNPLLGPNGAAAVYGPQKGATPEMVESLEANLAHLADVVHEKLGMDVREIPGGGAAGGLGAGLVAFAGASLQSGLPMVADAASSYVESPIARSR